MFAQKIVGDMQGMSSAEVPRPSRLVPHLSQNTTDISKNVKTTGISVTNVVFWLRRPLDMQEAPDRAVGDLSGS